MPNGSAKIVVLEIEKIQLFRKKCRAHLRFCRDCQKTTDFISLAEAASLFDVHLPVLYQFIQKNAGHYTSDSTGSIFVCVYSFLVCVNEKTKNSKIKMIEGEIQR